MEPGRQGLGIQPRQQAVVRQQHQTLNVVGVATGLDFAKDRVQAVQATAPQRLKPAWQRCVGLEVVDRGVVLTKPVIKAVGVFPPTEDLANHTLEAGQGHLLGQPLRFEALDDLQRMEQTQIQVRRQQGMPKGGFAAHHRVLERSKSRQTRCDEVIQDR